MSIAHLPQAAFVNRLIQVLTTGGVPALYPGQNDTFPYADNVDATHPLNVDFLLPSNFQKITAARLSFRLHAYRTYDAPAAAGLHVHFWSAPGLGTVVSGVGIDGSQRLVSPTFAFGKQTSTELWNPAPPAGPSLDTAVEGENLTGHVHTQVLGVTEGPVATGVSVALDGVDITAALGGPFSLDQVEIDFRPFLLAAGVPEPGYHTLALTPTGLGRIQSAVRLGYTVNPGLS